MSVLFRSTPRPADAALLIVRAITEYEWDSVILCHRVLYIWIDVNNSAHIIIVTM